MVYEGLRVKGNLGDSEEARSKRARKVPLKGKARLGLWKSSELAFGSQASKVSARECKAWALEIARVPLS